jgi:hypothetical protein
VIRTQWEIRNGLPWKLWEARIGLLWRLCEICDGLLRTRWAKLIRWRIGVGIGALRCWMGSLHNMTLGLKSTSILAHGGNGLDGLGMDGHGWAWEIEGKVELQKI